MNPSRLLVTMHCLVIAFCALGFGVVDTFGARAFRPPLLILLIVVVGCVLVFGFYACKLASRHARVPLYSADKPLLGQTDQRPSDNSD